MQERGGRDWTDEGNRYAAAEPEDHIAISTPSPRAPGDDLTVTPLGSEELGDKVKEHGDVFVKHCLIHHGKTTARWTLMRKPQLILPFNTS